MRLSLYLIIGVSVAAFLSQAPLAQAISSQTVIRTFVGSDTSAPTIPVIVSATPITYAQINVVWSASVDDIAVAGYRLFRDGVQIATTTLTSFNDGGLMPLTLYEYTVDAFDGFDNISSSSLPVATSTLSNSTPTTTPPITDAQSGTAVIATIQNITVVPGTQSAQISWQTNVNARYTLVWGRTTSYELGSVSTNLFKQSHETTLQNLEPGTHYWYAIEATTPRGVTKNVYRGEFVTIPVFVTSKLANVRNLVADVTDTTVRLSWRNPVLPTGAVVRVVRSHLFYPASPTDGALVYEGVGSEVLDKGALAQRSPQYYTVFVLDENGSYSGGALAVARKNGSSAEATSSPTIAAPSTGLPVEESGDDVVLLPENVLVRQGDVTTPLGQRLQLTTEQDYSIIVPVEAVTKNLKAIIVTVEDPTDQRIVSTYLLKLNQAGDAYEAVVQAPQVVGSARFSIEVFDFNLASVRKIKTTVVFVTPSVSTRVFPDELIRYSPLFFVPVVATLTGLMFLWWLMVFLRRPRLAEDNQ